MALQMINEIVLNNGGKGCHSFWGAIASRAIYSREFHGRLDALGDADTQNVAWVFEPVDSEWVCRAGQSTIEGAMAYMNDSRVLVLRSDPCESNRLLALIDEWNRLTNPAAMKSDDGHAADFRASEARYVNAAPRFSGEPRLPRAIEWLVVATYAWIRSILIHVDWLHLRFMPSGPQAPRRLSGELPEVRHGMLRVVFRRARMLQGVFRGESIR